MLYLGLMSGTSLDGIEAVLAEVSGEPPSVRAEVVRHAHVDYTAEQRARIRRAIEVGTAADLSRLNFDLGVWLADAALRCLREARVEPEEVVAVGSHGQTIWHEPPAGGMGSTLQLGEPAVIAERVGVAVVSGFRTRDVAAGGHGAPLVPSVDAWLFRAEKKRRAIQNVGGIANVTYLPPVESEEPVLGFDTGPGVAVLDAVVEIVTGGAERFDRNGELAARGRALGDLLEALLDDDYFRTRPPKSTGRERYGAAYAQRLVDGAVRAGGSPEDAVATAAALTARTIAGAYRDFLGGRVDECYVAGGGAKNPTLLRMLREDLHPIPVFDLSGLGVDPEAKEALAFAVLAHAHLRRRPGNLPEVTGAAGPRILGTFTPA